ncbi:MAG: hypothetical protein ABI333_02135 [bacterium]
MGFLRAPASALLSLALLGGCVEDQGRPPVARLQVEPRYVPVGVESLILLDGRKSCDEIDHPESCDKSVDGPGPPLTCPGGVSFRWSLDVPFIPVGGDAALQASSLEVRVTPDRPITVTLQVTDCDQITVTTKTQVGIILDYPTEDGTP